MARGAIQGKRHVKELTRYLSKQAQVVRASRPGCCDVRELNAETAILDGELAVPDHHGRTVFAAMMKRRHEAQFFGFDLLSLDGEDLY